MLSPRLLARVEEGHDSAAYWIAPGHPIRFVKIAARASQRQIGQFTFPTFGSRHNVFDVECGALQALMHQAILASVARPLPNRQRQFSR